MPPSRSTPAAKPTRTRLSGDERRAQITQAARVVFVRSGLAGSRTKDIAAEAGVNESLIYRHFASKEDLFEAAVAGPLEDAVTRLVERSGTPPEEFDVTGEEMVLRTERFLRDLFEVMDDVAPLLGVILFGDVDRASDYFRDRIAPSLDGIHRAIEANLGSWSHADFDVELVVATVFGAAWFLRTGDRLTGRRRDLDAAAHELATSIIYGLARPPAS